MRGLYNYKTATLQECEEDLLKIGEYLLNCDASETDFNGDLIILTKAIRIQNIAKRLSEI